MRVDVDDPCENRHGGVFESKSAFEGSKDYHGRDRDTIFALIAAAENGMTSQDLEAELLKGKNRFSGRLTELAAMGKIERRGRRDGAAIWMAVKRQGELF